ncbi:hypothetical protein AB0I28_34300 [Phytomonospora sp. NPDC050363]|uniref:hypothetical protein n=1 Tax=Phytomonospora sp. NPDC050363 TaxID=3155642 RepID=UPI0033DEB626
MLAHARLEHAGVGQAIGGIVDGRPVLIAGDSSVPPRLRVWDPAGGDEAEPAEFYAGFESTSDIAAGELGGEPVVVWGRYDGTVSIVDPNGDRAVREMYHPGIRVFGVALATVDGREVIVAGGDDRVVVGDPVTEEWRGGPDDFIGDDIGGDAEGDGGDDGDDEDEPDFDRVGIRCLDAGLVDGRPVAVTGAADGAVRVWDLGALKVVAEGEHGDEVSAVRVTELEGRAVAITGGRNGFVRVWALDGVLGDVAGGLIGDDSGVAPV